MKRIAATFLALSGSLVSYAHPIKPHVVRCGPADEVESKVELSFYYQSNEKKKKQCRVGVGSNQMKEKKWRDIDCKLRDSRKEIQFDLGDFENPLRLTIVRDAPDPEHAEGKIKGPWNKAQVDHALDCEVIFDE